MKINRLDLFQRKGTTLPKQLFCLALTTTLFQSTVFAAPPPNDHLANATVIAGSLPISVEGTNVDATAQAGEPNHSDSEPDEDAGRKSVWWQWTSPITGQIVLTTEGSGSQDSANPASTDPRVDTQVGVYTGNTIATLNLIAKKDDSDGRLAFGWTYLTFNAVQGTTYKIAVDGWRGATGRIRVNLSSGGTTQPPPTGDRRTLTLSISPSGAGTVTADPPQPSNGYANGTVVTLTVTPGEESTFTTWGGAASGSEETVTITMNANKTVTAILNANREILVQSIDDRTGLWLYNQTNFIGTTLFRNGAKVPGWRMVGTGDFNGDSKRDIVFQNTDGRLAVWIMDGTTFLRGASLRSVNRAWQARAIGDFNRDGSADIAFQHTNGQIAIWLMNGTDFDSSVLVREGKAVPGWRLFCADDVDANSSVDLVFQNSQGRIVAWGMNGTEFVEGINLASNRAAGAPWRAIGLADMNGDGSLDILWQHTDGRSAVWFQNGTAFSGSVYLPNSAATSAKIISAN